MLKKSIQYVKEEFFCEQEREVFFKTVSLTFIIGLIVHGYFYLNISYSHDALLVHFKDSYWKITLGRFLQPFLYFFKGNITLIWVFGLLSLFWISCANYLLIRMFNIQDKLSKICITLLLITNLSITYVNATYTYEIDTFMLALFFSILTVYSLQNFKYSLLITPSLVIATCALYQAYFAVTLVLLSFIAILDISKNPNTKQFLLEYTKKLSIILLGIVVYYILHKISFLIIGIKENEFDLYNTMDEVIVFNISEIVHLFIKTYSEFFHYFIRQETTYTYLVLLMHFILLALFIYTAFKNSLKLNIKNACILFIIICSLPFTMNLIFFISKSKANYQLTKYSFGFSYILIYIYVIRSFLNKSSIKNISLIILGIICVSNFFYTNTIYLHRILTYQNTISIMTKITSGIENTPGYVYNKTPIAFIGAFKASNANISRKGFEKVKGPGVDNTSITYSIEAYYNFITPYKINFVDDKKIVSLAKSTEVKEMPVYPSYGYIQWLDDIIIVKLSEPYQGNYVPSDTGYEKNH